jgi:ribosomal protein S18 acetylase RimI-like enzyme
MPSKPELVIGPYQPSDEAAVIALWEVCGLTRPWNDPAKDIARKLTTQPELFLIARHDRAVVGSAMAGYDGHRGWVYYLATAPDMQRHGIGQQLMTRVEELLTALGCPKLNLQIRTSNEEVAAFYKALGYQTDDVASMGKRLIADE